MRMLDAQVVMMIVVAFNFVQMMIMKRERDSDLVNVIFIDLAKEVILMVHLIIH